MKRERERERMWENNKKFIENNMRRKKKNKKYCNNTKLSKSHVMLCNKIALYYYILSLYIMQ